FEAQENGRRGLGVKEIDKGAPAREAGLKEGDLIVSANGTPVPELADLRRIIYSTGVDGLLHCVVVREGEELPISFALIDRLEEQE
ncbi:MAG: PDZ domain-containing protein, partial [Oscillospiraceae bacterium]|nr:PDZ domain-containing protein [Oscillospiraceae bacterium]